MSFMSPNFLFKEFKIGTLSDASCINMGNNWPSHFESHKKQNQGFGSITGDQNTVENIRSLLSDPDFIDMLNMDGQEEIPKWLEQAILEEARARGEDETSEED